MSHDRKRGANKSQPAVLSESEVQLEEYKTKCIKQGERLVKDVFPKKVLDLTALLESEKFSQSRISEITVKLNIPVPDPVLLNCEVQNSKKRKADCLNDGGEIQGTQVIGLPGGSVPVNCHLVEILDLVKPEAAELIGYTNQIKMWISYMVPKIEDGNNFGVSIQEDTISEARQVESEAASYLDQISRYFLTRGKIVSKVAKYPHVDDYRRTVQELDEKEFMSLKLVLTELRNHYASLHDIISKNLDKIKKPRSTNTDNMY